MSPESITEEYKRINCTISSLKNLLEVSAHQESNALKRYDLIMEVSRQLQELSKRSRELSNMSRSRSADLRNSLHATNY